MTLRPYQQTAIDNARSAVRAGHRAILLVAPTGAGKTRIGAAIVTGALARGHRVLWLAHRRELISQAAEAIGIPCGVISASSAVAPRPDLPLQVASIQTLQARDLWPAADLVVVDECHHAPSDAFATALARYADGLRIGLTATPQRADGRALGPPLFSTLVPVASVAELTAAGYLVPCEVVAPAGVLGPGQIAQRPVDAYLKHTPDESALVYAPSLASAWTFAEQFRAAGVPASIIDGTTETGLRAATLDSFRAGSLRVIVNVGVLTEGTDLPRCSAVIIARACGTLGLYLQIVGRALRPFAGKRHATLIDLRGVSHEHGHPSADRTWTLADSGIRTAGEAGDTQAYCRICSAPIQPGSGCDQCLAGPKEAQPLRVTQAPLIKYAHLQNAVIAEKTLASLIRTRGPRQGRAIFNNMMKRSR